MSPLTSLIILLFLLFVAICTVAWWTLTVRERTERARRAREARQEAPPPRRPREPASNDRVRGAKAPRKHAPADAGLLVPPGEPGVRVRPRRLEGEDPFDRFLDPDRRRGGDR